MIVPTTDLEQDSHCPRCHQKVHLYHRVLYDAPAYIMIMIYQIDPIGYVYVPPLYGERKLPGGDSTLGHWWGLLAAKPGDRKDGSNRVGWWRLTPNGRRFVLGRLFIRRVALIYNSQCHGYEGPLWHITDALGDQFNYRELMGLDD